MISGQPPIRQPMPPSDPPPPLPPGPPGPIGPRGPPPGTPGGSSPGPGGLPPPDFQCPARPSVGVDGRPIMLRANHFQVRMPQGFIHHYDIAIQPDKCPRRVNR